MNNFQYGDNFRESRDEIDTSTLSNTALNESLLINDTAITFAVYGYSTTFIRATFVLLLRIGYILVQLSCVPMEDIYIILKHNIIEMTVSMLSFALVGYSVAFGKDIQSIFKYENWIASSSLDFDEAILAFCTVIIANGIITTILSGRLHVVAYIISAIILSTIIYPPLIHWVSNSNGWMRHSKFLHQNVTLKDHAGGLVIHVSGGLVGFLGSVVLGRRLLLLNTIAPNSVGIDAPANSLIGYIFIIIGLIAYSLPSPAFNLLHSHNRRNYIAIIVLNQILGMATGVLVVYIIHYTFNRRHINYWLIQRSLQGGVVGIVALASGVDLYSPAIALVLAIITTTAFYIISVFVQLSAFEDTCNITAVNLLGGMLSILFPPIFGDREKLRDIVPKLGTIDLLWQIICLFSVLAILLLFCVFYFGVMNALQCLRNTEENVNHERAIFVSKKTKRSLVTRLFTLNRSTIDITPDLITRSPIIIPEKQHQDSQIDANVQELSKQKSIYTVNKMEVVATHIFPCGSGDAEQTLMKKSNGLVKCYELHRTKKCINILDGKSELNVNTANQYKPFSRSLDCMNYDKKFLDDIVTLKVPPTEYDNCSE